jgi:hypothetical protein
MLRPRQPWSPPVRVALTLLLAGWAAGSGAQTPPKHQEIELAMIYMQGSRFRMPITCTMPDGTLIEREESIAFRPGPATGDVPSLRATIFGIDAPEAKNCFNLIWPKLPDRRGVVILEYRARRRSDYGVTDFNRKLKSGKLTFYITGGRIQLRDFPQEEGVEPRELRFGDDNEPFTMSFVHPRSDGYKLLDHYEQSLDASDTRRRRVEFRFEGPEEFVFQGYYLEDEDRS